MKKNLGKIVSIIFILLTSVHVVEAQDFKWGASIDKKTAYVNEAVYLKYVCEFKDRGELYVIEFTPKSTDKFEITALTQSQKIRNNKRIQTYEYVAFAKVAGKIDFDFDINMKKTNKDSIENTVLGRDNAQFEEYNTIVLKHEKLSLDVKQIPVKLIGEFDIKIKKDDSKIKAYEPFHLTITIDGIGNLDGLEKLNFNNLDAEVFASEPQKEYTLTKDGYKGTWSQKFAFVSDKDFKIDGFEIKYFDLEQSKLKSLVFDKVNVEVTKAYTKVELLDDVEDESFTFNPEYIYYVLTFIAGFLLAKVRFKSNEIISKKEKTFKEKVKKTKTLEELQMLLILENTSKYKSIISQIDNGSIHSLSEVKKLL